MKILIRNDMITGGGVENVMYNLIQFLHKKNYDITVVTDLGSSEEFYNIFPENINYIKSGYKRKNLKRGTINWFCDRCKIFLYDVLFKIRMLRKFDVAIAMKEGPSMIAVAKSRSPKRFAWIHVDYNYSYWTHYHFSTASDERICMQQFDKVICVSNAVMKSVIDIIGDPGNLCVRYNPINYMEIRKKAEEKQLMIKPEGKLLFIAVGRLDPQKNYLMLIEVFAKLCKIRNDIELWIVGEGKQRKALEEKIKSVGVTEIKIIGEKKNPYPIIQMADCLINASRWESYGLVIQEAFILGTPVIATRCPAIEEIFDDRFGILVENTEEQLEKALLKVIQDPDLLKIYRTNIKNFYVTDILYEKRLEKVCNLWEQKNET